jgi:hypothetical protein
MLSLLKSPSVAVADGNAGRNVNGVPRPEKRVSDAVLGDQVVRLQQLLE